MFPCSEKDHGEGENHHEPVAYTDEQLSAIVDAVMKNMDRNNDGVVDWPEYTVKRNTLTAKSLPMGLPKVTAMRNHMTTLRYNPWLIR
uniref:EF-hand domain-containing protein n=1 Tax=Anopheles minimus TaxID=112268 RepID=A0A182VPV0_9DIPT